MIVTIFDGKASIRYKDVIKVQLLETETYRLTFDNGKVTTVYGSLICVERG